MKLSEYQDRFWSKIIKTDKCWEWTACKSNGYGELRIKGKKFLAHRFSYELLVGEIPKGLQIDHLCRNPSCVNPEHLEVVTQKENVLRGCGVTAQHARKTHCIHGHELIPENTYQKDGHRQCRVCWAEYRIEHREKYKAYMKNYHKMLKVITQ